ncbi:butyrophilin subfamily 3 member A2-like isoform X2 [Enoplosus armatus]|uniref:butyrophilin subfamily 3 member A2-like isoform X2 n=1 Tax=Enoplosus armatus TaxID=215367 RepID=UPI003996BE64
MVSRLLLAAGLLCCSSGQSSLHGPPEKLLGFAGGDVILPCSYNVTVHSDVPTVEWSKEGLEPDVIFLYRGGYETPEMKNPAFEYRTSFIWKELKDGNISLRISDLKPSDTGKYQCLRLWENAPQDITTVELTVGAVSEPKLSVVSAEGAGVTLQCEAGCWPLEPEVRFLDDQGNEIQADDPKRNVSGCYTVTRRVTLQEANKRVACRVHQPEINRTRDTHVLIAGDCVASCTLTTGLAVGGTVLFFLLFIFSGGLAVLYKKCGKYAEGQKSAVSRQSSDQSTLSGASESEPFLENVKAENTANSVIEDLRRQVADLKSELCEKEETIRRLQGNSSSPSHVVCQLDQPTMVCSAAAPNPPASGSLPQSQGPNPGISRRTSDAAPDRPLYRNRHVKSSPALFDSAGPSSSSSATSSKKKIHRFSRSLSESHARPGPNVPKLQRRHSSFSFLPSSPTENRFLLLADLTEESD